MAQVPLKVLLDGSAFMQHRRSGISRYLTELITAYDADPTLGVSAVTPYRFMTNVHAASTSRGFRSLPLPRQLRSPVLSRLNKRWEASAATAAVAHFPLYDANLLTQVSTLPSVTTVYDFTFEVLPALFGDKASDLATKKRFLEASDVLVCISEATQRDLHRFHPDLDKPVLVTPLGVGSEFFAARQGRPRGFPERYLLHVGNRAEHKNIDLVLNAFKVLAAADPDLHLVLSGQGLPSEAERLRTLDIAHRTKVLRVSDAHLPRAYRNAAAFVFPSRYEGFGLPLLEAMASNCPTLISDTPALIEVAGGAADVIDADDLDGTVAALQRILADREHANRLRNAGRRRAEDFTWHRTAALTADAYHQAARSAR